MLAAKDIDAPSATSPRIVPVDDTHHRMEWTTNEEENIADALSMMP